MKTDDFEARLRDALRTSAADVRPDPNAWLRLRERRERRRFAGLWLGLGGLTAATAAVLAVVTLNARPSPETVQFEPLAPASITAPTEVPPSANDLPAPSYWTVQAKAPGIVLTDVQGDVGSALFEDRTAECVDTEGCEAERVDIVRPKPGSTAAAPTLAYRMAFECFGATGVLGSPTQLLTPPPGCAAAPVWAPEGSHLGWVADGAGSTVDLTTFVGSSVEPNVTTVEGAEGLRGVTTEDWVWTGGSANGTAEGFVAFSGRRDDRIGTFWVPVARTTTGAIEVTGPLQQFDSGAGVATLGYANSHANEYAAVGPEYYLVANTTDTGVGGPALVRRADGDQSDRLELPADVIDPALPLGGGGWVTAAGDTVLVGDGVDQAWRVEWQGDNWGDLTPLPGAIRFAAPIPAGARSNEDFPTTPEPQPQRESTTAPATMEVQVYFPRAGVDDCATTFAYPRQVSRQTPATEALQELLAGPTTEERAAGAGGWFSEETAGLLRSIDIDQGLATVDLNDFRDLIPNASTSCGSTSFLSSLDNTLTQFPTVQETRYLIAGDAQAFLDFFGLSPEPETPRSEFTECLGRADDPAPCFEEPYPDGLPGDQDLPEAVAATRLALVLAAQSGDWDQVRELIPDDGPFVFNYDGEDDPGDLAGAEESYGPEVLEQIASVLTSEIGLPAESSFSDGGVYVWSVEGSLTSVGIRPTGGWEYFSGGS